jgi:hypothetical protein
MDYNTMITLFIAGILGIIAHGFKEASKRNKAQEPKYTIINYWTNEINSIMMCIICLIVISYYSSDIKQIKELPSYGIGPLYFGLGYMGDSAFPSLLDLIPKIIDKFKSIIGFGDKTPPPAI